MPGARLRRHGESQPVARTPRQSCDLLRFWRRPGSDATNARALRDFEPRRVRGRRRSANDVRERIRRRGLQIDARRNLPRSARRRCTAHRPKRLRSIAARWPVAVRREPRVHGTACVPAQAICGRRERLAVLQPRRARIDAYASFDRSSRRPSGASVASVARRPSAESWDVSMNASSIGWFPRPGTTSLRSLPANERAWASMRPVYR